MSIATKELTEYLKKQHHKKLVFAFYACNRYWFDGDEAVEPFAAFLLITNNEFTSAEEARVFARAAIYLNSKGEQP